MNIERLLQKVDSIAIFMESKFKLPKINRMEFLKDAYYLNELIFQFYQIAKSDLSRNEKITHITNLKTPNNKNFLTKKKATLLLDKLAPNIITIHDNIYNLRRHAVKTGINDMTGGSSNIPLSNNGCDKYCKFVQMQNNRQFGGSDKTKLINNLLRNKKKFPKKIANMIDTFIEFKNNVQCKIDNSVLNDSVILNGGSGVGVGKIPSTTTKKTQKSMKSTGMKKFQEILNKTGVSDSSNDTSTNNPQQSEHGDNNKKQKPLINPLVLKIFKKPAKFTANKVYETIMRIIETDYSFENLASMIPKKVSVAFNWIFFPLWSIENYTKHGGKIIKVPLDLIGIIIDNAPTFLKAFELISKLAVQTGLNIAQAIPVAGTFVSLGAIGVDFIMPIYSYLMSNGTGIISMIINISRKNWDEAFEMALASLPVIGDVFDAVTSNLDLARKYLDLINKNIVVATRMTEPIKKIIVSKLNGSIFFNRINRNIQTYKTMSSLILGNPEILYDPTGYVTTKILPHKKFIPFLSKFTDEEIYSMIEDINPGLQIMKKNPFYFIQNPDHFITLMEPIYLKIINKGNTHAHIGNIISIVNRSLLRFNKITDKFSFSKRLKRVKNMFPMRSIKEFVQYAIKTKKTIQQEEQENQEE